MSVGICPACRSTEMPGMQLLSARPGDRPFWNVCRVCKGRERIEIVSSAEARLAAVWMSPRQVVSAGTCPPAHGTFALRVSQCQPRGGDSGTLGILLAVLTFAAMACQPENGGTNQAPDAGATAGQIAQAGQTSPGMGVAGAGGQVETPDAQLVATVDAQPALLIDTSTTSQPDAQPVATPDALAPGCTDIMEPSTPGVGLLATTCAEVKAGQLCDGIHCLASCGLCPKQDAGPPVTAGCTDAVPPGTKIGYCAGMMADYGCGIFANGPYCHVTCGLCPATPCQDIAPTINPFNLASKIPMTCADWKQNGFCGEQYDVTGLPDDTIGAASATWCHFTCGLC